MKLRASWWKKLLQLLGLGVFALLGYWLTTNPDPQRQSYAPLVGWLCVASSIAVAAGSIRQLTRSGPQLIISEAGIEDRLNGLGLVPWTEIAAAKVRLYPNGSTIIIATQNPDVWRSRRTMSARWMAKLRAVMGLSEFVVVISGLERSPSDVVEVVRRHLGSRLSV